jgi:hypothetical protein
VDISTIILLALLLACPLMMLFMHRGHADKHATHDADQGNQEGTTSARPSSAGNALDAEITSGESRRPPPKAFPRR